jgi:hypothetical protein
MTSGPRRASRPISRACRAFLVSRELLQRKPRSPRGAAVDGSIWVIASRAGGSSREASSAGPSLRVVARLARCRRADGRFGERTAPGGFSTCRIAGPGGHRAAQPRGPSPSRTRAARRTCARELTGRAGRSRTGSLATFRKRRSCSRRRFESIRETLALNGLAEIWSSDFRSPPTRPCSTSRSGTRGAPSRRTETGRAVRLAGLRGTPAKRCLPPLTLCNSPRAHPVWPASVSG